MVRHSPRADLLVQTMSRLLTVLPTHPESAGKTALAEATEKGFEEIAGIIGAAPAEGEEGPAEGDGEFEDDEYDAVTASRGP